MDLLRQGDCGLSSDLQTQLTEYKHIYSQVKRIPKTDPTYLEANAKIAQKLGHVYKGLIMSEEGVKALTKAIEYMELQGPNMKNEDMVEVIIDLSFCLQRYKEPDNERILELIRKAIDLHAILWPCRIIQGLGADFSGWYQAQIAMTYQIMQKYDKAVEYFDKAFEVLLTTLPDRMPTDQTYGSLLNAKATCLVKMNKLDKAFEVFAKSDAIYDVCPQNQIVVVIQISNLADYSSALLKQKLFAHATMINSKAQGLIDSHPSLEHLLPRLIMFRMSMNTGEINLKSLNLQIASKNFLDAWKYIESHGGKGCNIEESVEAAKKAGSTFGLLGQHDRAKTYLFYAVGLIEKLYDDLDTNAEQRKEYFIVLNSLGSQCLKCEDFSEGVKYFKKAKALQPIPVPDALVGLSWMLGMCQLNIRNTKEAIENFNVCLEEWKSGMPPLDPGQITECHYKIGIAQYTLKCFDEAIESLEEYLSRLKEISHNGKTRTTFLLGICAINLDRLDLAVKYFKILAEKKKVELDMTELHDVFLCLGQCYIGLQNKDEAVKWFKKGQELIGKKPNKAKILQNLALVQGSNAQELSMMSKMNFKELKTYIEHLKVEQSMSSLFVK